MGKDWKEVRLRNIKRRTEIFKASVFKTLSKEFDDEYEEWFYFLDRKIYRTDGVKQLEVRE